MFADIVWAFSAPVTSASQRLVLIDLADRANSEHRCWPSQLTIAARTHLSERTVRGVLKDLETAGLIKREAHFDTDGHRSSDRVRLLIGQPSEVPRLAATCAAQSIGKKPSIEVAQAATVDSGLAALFQDDWEPMPQPEGGSIVNRRQETEGAAGDSCRENDLANPTNKDKEDLKRQIQPAVESAVDVSHRVLRDALMAILIGHVSPSLAQTSLPSRLDRFAPEAVREAATRVADRLRLGRSDKPIRSWNYLAAVLESECA